MFLLIFSGSIPAFLLKYNVFQEININPFTKIKLFWYNSLTSWSGTRTSYSTSLAPINIVLHTLPSIYNHERGRN